MGLNVAWLKGRHFQIDSAISVDDFGSLHHRFTQEKRNEVLNIASVKSIDLRGGKVPEVGVEGDFFADEESNEQKYTDVGNVFGEKVGGNS